MATVDKVIIQTGNKANLPVLTDGEFGLTEDESRLYIGSANGNVALPNANDLINVQNQVTDAVNTANTASSNVGNAITIANTANQTSNTALSTANNANSVANSKQDNTLNGTSAPSVNASKVGEFYVDTVNKKLYFY